MSRSTFPTARRGFRSAVRHREQELHMQKIGFVGVGKIGLPICQHLIRNGYSVVGYRRSSLAEFEHIGRSEEHTSELQSRGHLVCRLLLEKKKNKNRTLIFQSTTINIKAQQIT